MLLLVLWTVLWEACKSQVGLQGYCTKTLGTSTYPATLEAVLRTEEAVGAHFQTGGTLQSPRIIGAIETDAFARRDGCHGDEFQREGPS